MCSSTVHPELLMIREWKERMQAGDSTLMCTERAAVCFINKSQAYSNKRVVFSSVVRAFCCYVLVSLSHVPLPFILLRHCCAQALYSSCHASDSYSEGPSSNLIRDTDYPELRFPQSLQAKRLKGASVRAMKAYRGSSGIAPLIHNLGTRLLCGSLHAPAASPPGKNHSIHWIAGWVGPRAAWVWAFWKTKKCFAPYGIRDFTVLENAQGGFGAHLLGTWVLIPRSSPLLHYLFIIISSFRPVVRATDSVAKESVSRRLNPWFVSPTRVNNTSETIELCEWRHTGSHVVTI